MEFLFYISAFVAVIAAALVVISRKAAHALLYLVVSFIAVSAVFFTLQAPFIAVLEIIIYAGAIVVLFLFAVMMLNRGGLADRVERDSFRPAALIAPAILVAALLFSFFSIVNEEGMISPGPGGIGPYEIGRALFGPYLVAVELASVLLLAGLIGAFHIGRRLTKIK